MATEKDDIAILRRSVEGHGYRLGDLYDATQEKPIGINLWKSQDGVLVRAAALSECQRGATSHSCPIMFVFTGYCDKT